MTKRQPILECAFDPDQCNERETIRYYVAELEYYRPRGYAALVKEAQAILDAEDSDFDCWHEWYDEVDDLLTDWARRIERHDYISYGPFPHGGAVGFYIYHEGAIEDCDLKVDDLSEVPRGFSGLVVHVNDHGNVSAYQYSRGKSRELFAIV